MTEKDAYIKQLENTVETLQNQVEYLTELIKNMQIFNLDLCKK